MVIEPQVTDAGQEMVRLRLVIGSIGIGVDVLVYSEAEFERRSQVLHQAKTEGKVLYNAAA